MYLDWREQMWAAGKHKRRINCGAWSYQNQLAYGSDDKQISVTSETGQIQDQVCVCVCVTCITYVCMCAGVSSCLHLCVSRTCIIFRFGRHRNSLFGGGSLVSSLFLSVAVEAWPFIYRMYVVFA